MRLARGKCKIFGIFGKYLKQDARNFVLNLAESSLLECEGQALGYLLGSS